MANERELFEVITSLCKLGQRCELAVSLVFFLSHSPQSMPNEAFNMTQQNICAICCVRLVSMRFVC